MCGIAGLSQEDRKRMERMVKRLDHRGPDGQGTYVGHGISIGHTRLAILDPRPDGNQPMWNDTGTAVITFNGEIFNYRHLREEEHFSCKTNTDTEVLLKLFDRYGMSFVSRLRGMFAFGIYDTRTHTWHLARDPNGINPLFVAYPHGQLSFASETRALMAAFDTKPALDENALSLFLRLQYVPTPATLCTGISSLPPGTVLSWKKEKEERHTVIPQEDPPRFSSKEEFREVFPQIMDTAVRDHLLSDRPIGVSLSGGMDSSTVLHHMCRHVAAPVRTFTVRFEATKKEGADRFNRDADLAALTARHYGTDHHEILLSAALCRTLYKAASRALDQPNADPVAMAQYALAREARKDVTVLLCGAGGDELFGGYPRYRIARVLQILQPIPAALRRAAANLAGYPPDVLTLSPGPLLAERLLARPVEELRDIVQGDWFDPSATTRLFQGHFAAQDTTDAVRAFMEVDRGLWLVDESLRLCDGVSLASGVECRIPFLDQRVMAASHATPSHWHTTLRRTKALLKDTYRSILPPHLFTLDKASFYPPLAKWIRREMLTLVEEALENTAIQPYFHVEMVRALLARHTAHETYALHTLSSILQLSTWFDVVYNATDE